MSTKIFVHIPLGRAEQKALESSKTPKSPDKPSYDPEFERQYRELEAQERRQRAKVRHAKRMIVASRAREIWRAYYYNASDLKRAAGNTGLIGQVMPPTHADAISHILRKMADSEADSPSCLLCSTTFDKIDLMDRDKKLFLPRGFLVCESELRPGSMICTVVCDSCNSKFNQRELMSLARENFYKYMPYSDFKSDESTEVVFIPCKVRLNKIRFGDISMDESVEHSHMTTELARGILAHGRSKY